MLEASWPRGLTRPTDSSVIPIIRAALAEDIGSGDITTQATVPPGAFAEGCFLAKSAGIVAGLWVTTMVFADLSPDIHLEFAVGEASPVVAGQTIGRLRGPAQPILSGERVALNFLQRLSGIATAAQAAVAAVAGTKARIIDTRKTTPGLRLLEKYAVRAGGAANHRFGLYDMVLIKDNHIRLSGGIAAAVAAVRRSVGPMVKIEVEVANLEEVREAVAARVDLIMLDNMSTRQMRDAVDLIAGQAIVEASGGVTLANCADVAAAGVDLISMGSLTHSYMALDISLELELSPGLTPDAG